MSKINPTVPVKTALYPELQKGGAPVMDKAWHDFFNALGRGITRLDEHDAELAILLARPRTKLPTITQDTHAHRLTRPPVTDLSLFYETDRTVWYLAVGGTWIYYTGVMSGLLTNIPTDLDNTHDTGFQYHATDYGHTWFWQSSTYNFGPGESSGQIVAVTATSAPAGGVWHACDGSTVSISKATGATAAALIQSVTLPDLTGNVMIMGGTLGRTAAAAYLSQNVPQGTGSNISVPQVLAPNETNGGMPLRIGVTFYVRQ